MATQFLHVQVGRPEGFHVRTNTPRIETVPLGIIRNYSRFKLNLTKSLTRKCKSRGLGGHGVRQVRQHGANVPVPGGGGNHGLRGAALA